MKGDHGGEVGSARALEGWVRVVQELGIGRHFCGVFSPKKRGGKIPLTSRLSRSIGNGGYWLIVVLEGMEPDLWSSPVEMDRKLGSEKLIPQIIGILSNAQ